MRGVPPRAKRQTSPHRSGRRFLLDKPSNVLSLEGIFQRGGISGRIHSLDFEQNAVKCLKNNRLKFSDRNDINCFKSNTCAKLVQSPGLSLTNFLSLTRLIYKSFRVSAKVFKNRLLETHQSQIRRGHSEGAKRLKNLIILAH